VKNRSIQLNFDMRWNLQCNLVSINQGAVR